MQAEEKIFQYPESFNLTVYSIEAQSGTQVMELPFIEPYLNKQKAFKRTQELGNLNYDVELKEFVFTPQELQTIGVIKLLTFGYDEYPSHSAGGLLHILLDDGNYDCIDSCLKDATTMGDIPAQLICHLMKQFTEVKLRLFYENWNLFSEAIDKVHQYKMDNWIKFIYP